MSQPTIRMATDADRAALARIWDYCFGDGETFERWYFSTYYRQEECLLAEVEGEVAASLQVIDLPTRVGGEVVRAGYIVGVDCLPEYRGQGLTRRLMAAALEDYAPRHGLALMHLMPFEADFYESYGFVYGDFHFDMDLDILEFYRPEDRAAARSHRFERLTPEALGEHLSELEALYARATARYDAAVCRSGLRRWQALADDLAMDGGHLILLRADDGEATGLLAYKLRENAFFVREALHATPQARQALYYFIASHRSQVGRVQWSAPEDEAVAFRRRKDKDGVRYRPFMMHRILDARILPLFASSLPEEDLCFAVNDGMGAWRWLAGSRKLQALETPTEAVLDATDLTRLVFDRSHDLPDEDPVLCKLAALFTKKATFFNNEYF